METILGIGAAAIFGSILVFILYRRASGKGSCCSKQPK